MSLAVLFFKALAFALGLILLSAGMAMAVSTPFVEILQSRPNEGRRLLVLGFALLGLGYLLLVLVGGGW